MNVETLTHQQTLFVEAYFRYFGNASRAAADAGYKQPYKSGNQLLTYPHIRRAIAQRRKHFFKDTSATIERLVGELQLMAFYDIGDIFSDDDRLLRVREMAPAIRRTVKKVKVRRYRTEDGEEEEVIEVEMADKQGAIDKLLKVIGGYAPAEVAVDVDAPIPIAKVREVVEAAFRKVEQPKPPPLPDPSTIRPDAIEVPPPPPVSAQPPLQEKDDYSHIRGQIDLVALRRRQAEEKGKKGPG